MSTFICSNSFHFASFCYITFNSLFSISSVLHAAVFIMLADLILGWFYFEKRRIVVLSCEAESSELWRCLVWMLISYNCYLKKATYSVCTHLVAPNWPLNVWCIHEVCLPKPHFFSFLFFWSANLYICNATCFLLAVNFDLVFVGMLERGGRGGIHMCVSSFGCCLIFLDFIVVTCILQL